MLTKSQNETTHPYKPNRRQGNHLPFQDVPLRQCARCKVTAHATCYSFIEGFAGTNIKKEPELVVQNVVTDIKPVAIAGLPKMSQKLKMIRLKAPASVKKELADVNLEEEQMSPGPSTKKAKPVVKKPNFIFNSIMKRVKPECKSFCGF
jgi:hypothetical protein